MRKLPTPTKRQVTLAARSFNMERLEAARMFGLPLPKRLTMPVTFIETTGTLTDSMVKEFMRARRLMKAVYSSGDLDPKDFGIASTIDPIITLDVNPINLIKGHLADEWSYDGFYLQASFFDPKKVTCAIPYRSTSTAQTFYDIFVEKTGSLEPKDHQPIQQSYRQVQELNLTISGFYFAEIGVWRRVLLLYRTAVLVMLRAVWMGRDPLQEYDRFLKAGGKYFLDYPALCP